MRGESCIQHTFALRRGSRAGCCERAGARRVRGRCIDWAAAPEPAECGPHASRTHSRTAENVGATAAAAAAGRLLLGRGRRPAAARVPLSGESLIAAKHTKIIPMRGASRQIV
jgi:hypothetical protein